nr:CHASE2 domain-containing protein [Treponema sp. OMZ 788]
MQNNLNFIIAIIVFLIFTAFSFIKLGRNIENQVYDAMLRLKPEIEEKSEVLLLNVDDFSIEQVGSWPWSRDVLADVLIRLKEAGGKAAVFDIEYLSAGRAGANNAYVEHELPKEYAAVRQEFGEYIKEFSDAVASKNIPLSEVKTIGKDMSDYFQLRIEELSDSIKHNVFRDNDVYMGAAAGFFENSFLTINAVNINISSETKELKDFAYNNFLFTNIEDEAGLLKKETLANRKAANEEYGMAPAIMPILKYARGAGFPNVVIDEDGVRRRISLLTEYEGRYIGQLVFTPILHILEPEKIIRTGRRLILKNAKDPSDLEKRKDLIIPLDEDGNLLINWLKKRFADTDNPENGSFKSLSVYALTYADIMEKNLVSLLEAIKNLQIRTAEGYLSYHSAVTSLESEYSRLGEWKNELLNKNRQDFKEYFTARDSFFDNYSKFLSGDFDKEIIGLFAKIKEQSGSTEYDTIEAYAADLFTKAKEEYKNYSDHINYIKGFCNNAFAIIGYSGVGTSDLGVNPFWKSYPNVGTHANIYNTIMNEDFITPLPKWVSIILAFVIAIFTAFILKKSRKRFYQGTCRNRVIKLNSFLGNSFIRIRQDIPSALSSGCNGGYQLYSNPLT